jgi:hypothetical protein
MSTAICPIDCSALLPVLEFSDCAPAIKSGRLTRMYMSNEDFTDITDISEWNTRLSNTSSDADAVREFTIIGDKPAPESTQIEISDGRFAALSKTHVVNIEIDELSDDTFEALRILECGGNRKVWFGDSAGYLYGHPDDVNNGISASIILNHIIPQSLEELQKFVGTATWKYQFHWARVASPLA